MSTRPGAAQTQQPGDANEDAAEKIKRDLQKWHGDAQMLSRNIPFKQVFIDCAGSDIAMLKNREVAVLFEELGAEISRRIGL